MSAKLKVLAVDDTQMMRAMLEHFLIKAGYAVILAGSGEEAVELCASERPDIVIMDVVMGDMNGFEAARRIKAQAGGRYIPIAFLTAQSNEDDMLAGLEAGGDDYLLKPVNYALLKAKLGSLSKTLNALRETESHRDRLSAEADEAREAFGKFLARSDCAGASRVEFRGGRFGGELLASQEGSDGRSWALAASAPGGGLGGSLWLLPLAIRFEDMVKQGYGFAKIVSALNELAGEFLPDGKSVECALLAADRSRSEIEIAACGFENIWLFEGGKAKRMNPGSARLGSLGSAGALSACSRLPAEKGSILFAGTSSLAKLRREDGALLDEALPACALAENAAGAAKTLSEKFAAFSKGAKPVYDAQALFLDI